MCKSSDLLPNFLLRPIDFSPNIVHNYNNNYIGGYSYDYKS